MGLFSLCSSGSNRVISSGIRLGSSGPGRDYDPDVVTQVKNLQTTVNKLAKEVERLPDASKYEIVDKLCIGNKLIVKIKYPNCTNYEGMKILVYENISWYRLSQQTYIDPHFVDHGTYSPIARFEPTERGWQMAIAFCEAFEG